MALDSGVRFGPYEILSAIGAGGMGEVYRARDTTLRRDVAVKVLPAEFAADADRLARFEREARLLASLSHPNIAAVFGVEADATPTRTIRAIVMEFVDGETLSDRLQRGPVAMREALKIGRQIADALEAAHRRGIVHRDLKPANIRVTPGGLVKVLDFGLAKALERATPETLEADAAASTLAAHSLTRSGMLVGTVAYMSPEQARGLAVDERADLWALGCVVYELLADRRAFSGATSTDALAAIVERDPDWSALPSSTPAPVRRLLRRCLRKDPAERLQHAGDARLDFEDAQAMPPDVGAGNAIRLSRRWVAWTSVGALAISTIVLGAITLRPAARPVEIRFETTASGLVTPLSSIAIAPDGSQIVVAPGFEQGAPLWLRPLDSMSGRTLKGTEGAFLPFWSDDGRSIGFFANRKLQRVELESGVVRIVADAPVGRGAAWASDGTIVFAPTVSGPLLRVSAEGGAASPLTQLVPGQNDHRAPQFLPGERHILYYARGTPQVRGVYVAKRDGTNAQRLIDADSPAVYAPQGQLLFVRDGVLYAQAFDATRLAVSGQPFPVADGVALNQGVSLATLSASASGTIAYGSSSTRRAQFAWFDRAGKRVAAVGPNDIVGGNPALSPDGKTLAFNRIVDLNWDIWLLDIGRDVLTRVTSESALDFRPVWMPDGRRIVYQSNRGALINLYLRSVDGSGGEELLLSSSAGKGPTDVSRDGGFLLYDEISPDTSGDVWTLPLTGTNALTPRPVVQTKFLEREGQFSPDGRWLAYSSNETGRPEVYVQPFPGPGARTQVSSNGGVQLRWSRRGTELFYVDFKGWLTAAAVTPGTDSIAVGRPEPLFATPFDFSSQGPRGGYVVSEDAQRFLMAAPTGAATSSTIVVILNWRGRP
jgi:serine/threonine protein kinase/dipeptidyl aminopeptidase/acylaminoacyl peptidase